jgi:hypothetical protein
MEPKFCPVCGDPSVVPIKPQNGLASKPEQPMHTVVLSYRCEAGHVFARRQVICEKSCDSTEKNSAA